MIEKGKEPISLSYKRPAIEEVFLNHLKARRSITIKSAIAFIEKRKSEVIVVPVGRPVDAPDASKAKIAFVGEEGKEKDETN